MYQQTKKLNSWERGLIAAAPGRKLGSPLRRCLGSGRRPGGGVGAVSAGFYLLRHIFSSYVFIFVTMINKETVGLLKKALGDCRSNAEIKLLKEAGGETQRLTVIPPPWVPQPVSPVPSSLSAQSVAHPPHCPNLLGSCDPGDSRRTKPRPSGASGPLLPDWIALQNQFRMDDGWKLIFIFRLRK